MRERERERERESGAIDSSLGKGASPLAERESERERERERGPLARGVRAEYGDSREHGPLRVRLHVMHVGHAHPQHLPPRFVKISILILKNTRETRTARARREPGRDATRYVSRFYDTLVSTGVGDARCVCLKTATCVTATTRRSRALSRWSQSLSREFPVCCTIQKRKVSVHLDSWALARDGSSVNLTRIGTVEPSNR